MARGFHTRTACADWRGQDNKQGGPTAAPPSLSDFSAYFAFCLYPRKSAHAVRVALLRGPFFIFSEPLDGLVPPGAGRSLPRVEGPNVTAREPRPAERHRPQGRASVRDRPGPELFHRVPVHVQFGPGL